jgi:hypothetical protein
VHAQRRIEEAIQPFDHQLNAPIIARDSAEWRISMSVKSASHTYGFWGGQMSEMPVYRPVGLRGAARIALWSQDSADGVAGSRITVGK